LRAQETGVGLGGGFLVGEIEAVEGVLLAPASALVSAAFGARAGIGRNLGSANGAGGWRLHGNLRFTNYDLRLNEGAVAPLKIGEAGVPSFVNRNS
jgi:hypothetical protein